MARQLSTQWVHLCSGTQSIIKDHINETKRRWKEVACLAQDQSKDVAGLRQRLTQAEQALAEARRLNGEVRLPPSQSSMPALWHIMVHQNAEELCSLRYSGWLNASSSAWSLLACIKRGGI